MQEITICLSDIPQDKRFKSEKTGKVYGTFTVADRKEKDNYGNDLTVYMKQTKEERENKKEKSYVGSGKTLNFQKPTPDATPAPNNITELDDEMPF